MYYYQWRNPVLIIGGGDESFCKIIDFGGKKAAIIPPCQNLWRYPPISPLPRELRLYDYYTHTNIRTCTHARIHTHTHTKCLIF